MFTLIAVVLPVRSQLTSDSNTPNSKGKQKVITFKDADKIVVGYVDNKEFVSGQYVDIYNYHFNMKEKYDVYIENGLLVVKHGKETMSITPFLSGTYYEDSYMPYIKGKLYNGNVSMKGCFYISNMSDNDEPKLSPVTKGGYFSISPAYDYDLTEIRARNVPYDRYSGTPRFDIFTHGKGNRFRTSAIPTSSIENIDSITFTTTGFPDICQGTSLSVKDILKLSDGEPTIYYHNGDIFTGSIRDMKPYKGTYRYHTGEILEGNYHPVGIGAFRHGYEDCRVTFSDGTIAEDEWLKQYDKPPYDITTLKPNVRFEEEDWKELDRCTTWTEMRNRASELYELRLQEIQNNEITEKQKKDEKRDELIAKYGPKYGSLLVQGKIAIGMTSKMVAEIYPKALYRISLITSGGRNKEVWTFNRRLVSGSALMGLTYGLVDAMGYNAPKRMVFIRGRLTDIIR